MQFAKFRWSVRNVSERFWKSNSANLPAFQLGILEKTVHVWTLGWVSTKRCQAGGFAVCSKKGKGSYEDIWHTELYMTIWTCLIWSHRISIWKAGQNHVLCETSKKSWHVECKEGSVNSFPEPVPSVYMFPCPVPVTSMAWVKMVIFLSRAEDVAWFSQEGYSPIRIALSVQVYNYCISVCLNRSHSFFTHSVDLRYFRLACSAGRCHAWTSEWGHWFPIKEGLKGVAIAEFHTDMTESVQGLQCQEWSWKYFDSFWFVVLPLLPFNSMPFPFYNPVGLHGLSIFAPMERRQWSQSDAWRATGNRLCSLTFYGKKVTPLREEKVALKVWNNWQAHVAYGSQSNYQICIGKWGALQSRICCRHTKNMAPVGFVKDWLSSHLLVRNSSIERPALACSSESTCLHVCLLSLKVYSGVVEICSSLWQGKFRRVCWRVLAAVQEMPFFESFSMMLGAARQLVTEWQLGGCLCFGGPLTVASTGSTYRVITVNGDGNCFFRAVAQGEVATVHSRRSIAEEDARSKEPWCISGIFCFVFANIRRTFWTCALTFVFTL